MRARTSEPNARSEITSGFRLYQLLIKLGESRRILVGRHGRFVFPGGYYVYTGSAKQGRESRIARHLSSRKRLRWHVDYLLLHGKVVAVRRYDGPLTECELNNGTASEGGRVVVDGFGSSDCACQTHLLYFRLRPRGYRISSSSSRGARGGTG